MTGCWWYRERPMAFLFLLPALALLGLFLLVPAGQALWFSFQHYSLLRPGEREWVGLENYLALVRDPGFRQAFWNTGLFAAVVVPVQAALALALALLVNGTGWGRRLLRSAIFAPVITSMVVLSVLWALLYNPDVGLINALLQKVGLPPQPWLTSPHQALPAIMLMSIWQGVGFQMVIFLAGLQAIPPELYEAATLDGASRARQFWTITLPLLRNTTMFVVVTTTILAAKLFVQPFVMTQGGPDGATRTIILYLYREGFTAANMGRASAVAVIFFLVVSALTLTARFAREEGPR